MNFIAFGILLSSQLTYGIEKKWCASAIMLRHRYGRLVRPSSMEVGVALK